MINSKYINKICYCGIAIVLIITILFINGEKVGIKKADTTPKYAVSLFDTSKVHEIDIVMNNFDSFLKTCESEEYTKCSLVIDGNSVKNIAIRGKGNTSLRSVKEYNSQRYSFKIEFDHYNSANTYLGLDKLCLNNIIQDNTYMKDYLAYTLMNESGVNSPLCSFAHITVNGEEWGLYLAVEAIDNSFLKRCYGKNYGNLYKPDAMNMGGGKGNGKAFDKDKFEKEKVKGKEKVKENKSTTTEETKEKLTSSVTSENSSQSEMRQEMPNGTPPEKPNGEGGGNFGAEGPPDMPKGNFDPNGTPLEKPNEDNENNFNGEGGPPAIPNGEKGEEPIPPNEKIVTSDASVNTQETAENTKPNFNNGGESGNKPTDVALIYSDDNLKSYSNIFDNAKTNATKNDKKNLVKALKNLNSYTNLEKYIDTESVIKYFMVHNFMLNDDSYTGSMTHNYYLYQSNDNLLSMLPWDYNLSFGGFAGGNNTTSLINRPIDNAVTSGSSEDKPMINFIYKNKDYLTAYHNEYTKFINKFYTKGRLTEIINKTHKLIAPFVKKDKTKFCTYKEYLQGVKVLKTFTNKRLESIKSQLNGTVSSVKYDADNKLNVSGTGINTSVMGSMGEKGNTKKK